MLLADDAKKDFKNFYLSDTKANHIVVGDIGSAWSHTLLNEIFNSLMEGANLIARHKNRFWQTEHGLQIDIGGFIDSLECASGIKAMVIRKPSIHFFQIALDDMGLNANEVIVIGDDIDADIGGGQNAGLKAILVKTGKYRLNYVAASMIQPDSIKELPSVLGL